MLRRAILVLLCLWGIGLAAQDIGDIQVHGFATQGFLISSNNNYLGMKSSRGRLEWTEGAISVTDMLSDKLRVGIQMHMREMGRFGGPDVEVDWALGDYKVNDQIGFRAGKVKIPMGLFNDSQDVDALFLWVLLPQAMYPDDNRDYDLAMLGGEFYGGLPLGKRSGRLEYRGYIGDSRLDPDGGYMQQLQDNGLTFYSPPEGRDFGGDVHWVTPLYGLTVGSSAQSQALDGAGPQASFHMPPQLSLAQYAEWKRGKLYVAAEYWRTPMYPPMTVGSQTFVVPFDQRAWYSMVSYQFTQKLQVGAYYSHYVNKASDTSQPANYSKDWVISGRYDFNEYFYGKLEGHFQHGTGLGYYPSVNPNGLKPNSNMLAARVGFTF